MRIELTIDEINLILRGLAKLPYEQVALLIPGIQEQAKRQLEQEDTLEWQSSTT